MALVIGRFGPIPLRIHWTWVPGLIGMGGITSVLFQPHVGMAAAWLAGIGTVLLVYLAILLHELAHAFASRYTGMPVRAVTLFGFGGRTEVDEATLIPTHELLIACAGPLASLCLTCVWYLASHWLIGGILPLVVFAQVVMNAGLLVLNLLPSMPLDGGRILKASLWLLFNDEMPAARTASIIARICGWVLVGLGVVCVINVGAVLVGVACCVTGFYLSRTAVTGLQELALQRALTGVVVSAIMQRTLARVAPELPLDQFVGRYVLGQAEQSFPVVADPEQTTIQPLLGMLTTRNLRRFPFKQWATTRVVDAMTSVERVTLLTPQTSADEALRLLIEHDQDLLPVVEQGLLVGVVRRRDVLFFIRMRAGRDLQ